MIRIKVLDWFSRQDLGKVKVSLICAGSYPGIDRFIGLGELQTDQLASLADTRVRVQEPQYRTSRAAWSAFTSPDPVEIERFLALDSSALPFIAAALRRHLEQFPSAENGLSRTEHQALSVLVKDSLSGSRLFIAVQRMEEQIFMSHESFKRVIAELAHAPHPLVETHGHTTTRVVSITEVGRSVLEGGADHIELNGIDRWLGGVHLSGREGVWRWDRRLGRLAKPAS